MRVGLKTSCMASLLAIGMWSSLSAPSSASLGGCFVTVTRNCSELTTPDNCSGGCVLYFEECGTDHVKDPEKTYSGVAIPEWPNKGVDKRVENMAEVECGTKWLCKCIPILGDAGPQMFCITMKNSGRDENKIGALKTKPYAADASGAECDGILTDPLPDPNIAISAP